MGPIPNLTIGTRSHDRGNLVMWPDYIINFFATKKCHMTVGKSHMTWLHNHFSDHQKRSHDLVTAPGHMTTAAINRSRPHWETLAGLPAPEIWPKTHGKPLLGIYHQFFWHNLAVTSVSSCATLTTVLTYWMVTTAGLVDIFPTQQYWRHQPLTESRAQCLCRQSSWWGWVPSSLIGQRLPSVLQ